MTRLELQAISRHHVKLVKLTPDNIGKITEYKDQESQLPAQIFAAKQREVSTH